MHYPSNSSAISPETVLHGLERQQSSNSIACKAMQTYSDYSIRSDNPYEVLMNAPYAQGDSLASAWKDLTEDLSVLTDTHTSYDPYKVLSIFNSLVTLYDPVHKAERLLHHADKNDYPHLSSKEMPIRSAYRKILKLTLSHLEYFIENNTDLQIEEGFIIANQTLSQKIAPHTGDSSGVNYISEELANSLTAKQSFQQDSPEEN